MHEILTSKEVGINKFKKKLIYAIVQFYTISTILFKQTILILDCHVYMRYTEK